MGSVQFAEIGIEIEDIRHTLGINLLPSNINTRFRINPDAREIELFHLAIRLPKIKSRSSPACVDHCSSIPRRLLAGSLWLLLTNEDEKRKHCVQMGGWEGGQGALLEGVDVVEYAAPSQGRGVTEAPTLYIRC